MTPITRWLDFTPIWDMTTRAIRLSRPVIIMPADRNMAPATRAQAEVENPESPICRAFPVPRRVSGLAGLGAMPRENAINTTITNALTG